MTSGMNPTLVVIERVARSLATGGALGIAVMALQGLWQARRRPMGRLSGVSYRQMPLPAFVGIGVVYLLACIRLWRPLPIRLSRLGLIAALVAGVGSYISGIGLIVWGRIALGQMYNFSTTRGAELYANQRLVTTGPFGLVRHPMYVGALFAAIGGVLIYRTWTLVFILLHYPIFIVRARKEEEVLEAEFGEEWRAYARRVPGVIT